MQRKEDWGALERELLRHGDVLTVDLPGWGTADILPEEYGVDFLAAALDHILGDLDVTGVNVLAGSYGTGIAFTLAQRHPGRIGRLVLSSGMLAIPDSAVARMLRVLELLDLERMADFADACVDLLIPAPRTIRGRAVRRLMQARFRDAPRAELHRHAVNTRRLLRHRALDAAAPVTRPTLVISGEYDDFTTPQHGRELAASCVDSWFAEFGGVGHLLHLERPAELVAVAAQFWSGQEVTAPIITRYQRGGFCAERFRDPSAAPFPSPRGGRLVEAARELSAAPSTSA